MTWRAVQMIGGTPLVKDLLTVKLASCGWHVEAVSPLVLLLDGPSGYALRYLSDEKGSSTVVVTDNPCPEYWEDLWASSPLALVACMDAATVTQALEQAAEGEGVRILPARSSRLSSQERALLRLSALGWENRRIARAVGLHDGTVRNALGRVFDKIGVQNRTQAALYYWGVWSPVDKDCH